MTTFASSNALLAIHPLKPTRKILELGHAHAQGLQLQEDISHSDNHKEYIRNIYMIHVPRDQHQEESGLGVGVGR